MLTANQEQLRTVLAFLADEPPVLCDWLPWNHTFGGNHNFGLTLYNGGTLYIDAGAPTPAGFATTAANLREIATTAYFNVPRGYDLLLQALRGDADLRHRFFGRLQILFYAAAGLRQEVSDGIDRLAVEACGERVPWVTGLGATETAPFALCTGAMPAPVSGRVGVPAPGVELKLEPVGALLEARVRGPNVTPGYWRDPALTARRVRRRGLLRDGRRARLRRSGRSRARVHLPGPHRRGLQALDRHVGAGRAAARGAARGARRAGAGRRHRGARARRRARARVPEPRRVPPPRRPPGGGAGRRRARRRRRLRQRSRPRCRPSARRRPAAPRASRARCCWRSRRRSTRGEITDKGSINQKAVLRRRAAFVDALYGAGPPIRFIEVEERTIDA